MESVIVLCFVVSYFLSILVCNHLDGEERANFFAYFVFLEPCDCCVALSRGAMGLSEVCDCGISLSYSLTISVCLQRIPAHGGIHRNERAYVLAKLGATGNQHLNIVTHQEKATAIKTLTKTKSSKDDYQFLERWEQVIIFRFRTGHNRLNAHMCPKLKLSTPPCAIVAKSNGQQSTSCSDANGWSK